MIDELELLKEDWRKREEHLPRLSYDQIYKMIWKKSSSLVRWIFYISIIEFLLPHLLYLIPSFRDGSSYDIARSLGINQWLIALTAVQYLVALFFILQFYKRYREISALDDARKLMNRIIRTRRTVKNYVIVSLSLILLVFAVFVTGMYLDDNLAASLGVTPGPGRVSPGELKWIMIGVMAAAGIFFTALMGGIYFLLYGLLTRKLFRNYQELKRMEA
ncbi:hypothetical protein [Robiginitalea marina]|uniref:Glycerophosphoryl diester phosphodiesterase membrane domain-containing protein n=1 Tax=Robiginitalea marina TaxID=2954105 RepID=A0ABT1AUV5_9FLAO|nr:hypothetical protein [Robiginitalea marina]MCO5723835.1 hypothetical protein [Robiginitalea marina]